jgi:ABC-type multidrug transport system fused ATPase/permease subunit
VVETEILKALRSADLPSTIVVVAYRPSSIRLADEVVFLADGRIVDRISAPTAASVLDSLTAAGAAGPKGA